jgi:O-antigen/teichoic acid export membrane protein
MIRSIRQSDFVRSVATLITGTILAQLITYLLSPVITRLYDPEETSYLSLFARIIAFFAVVATARYELAFSLPKRDEHAFSLYRVSLRIALAMFAASLVLAGLVSFAHFDDPAVAAITWFIPFGILFTALYNQGMNWAVRLKNFRAISTSKILQSGLNSGISLALYPLGYKGLIIAHLASMIGATGVFLRSLKMAAKRMSPFRLRGRKWAIAKYYADFPRINMPHALIDLSKELFIAFYLIWAFEKEVLGLYDFSFRMLKAPLGLVGSAVSQVFFKKAADTVNEGVSLYALARKTVLLLFLLSLVPFGILMAFGAPIFAFMFGEAWREAGYYAQIMAPWLMVNFIVSPVSQIPLILNKQRKFFVLGIIGSALLIFSLAIGDIFPSWRLSFAEILMIVSYGQFIFLTFVVFWTLKLAKS